MTSSGVAGADPGRWRGVPRSGRCISDGDGSVEASAGSAGGDPAGGCSLQGPTAFVDEMMVVAAHKGEVGQVGHAAIFEEVEVVGLAPARCAVTAREDAAAIPDDQCLALLAGGEPDRSAVVEDRAVGAEDEAGDAAVAGEAPGGVDRNRSGTS